MIVLHGWLFAIRAEQTCRQPDKILYLRYLSTKMGGQVNALRASEGSTETGQDYSSSGFAKTNPMNEAKHPKTTPNALLGKHPMNALD